MTQLELQTLIPGHRIIAIRDLYYIENNDGARVTEPESWADTVASALEINTREGIEVARRRQALLRAVVELSWDSGGLVQMIGAVNLKAGDIVQFTYEGATYKGSVAAAMEYENGATEWTLWTRLGAIGYEMGWITHINNTPVRHIDGVRFARREEE